MTWEKISGSIGVQLNFKHLVVCLRLTKRLPAEGIPLGLWKGQAAGMSWVQIHGEHRLITGLEIISMNYRNRNTLRVLQLWGSACFVYIETYQRRSPAVRDPRFDSWSNRDLLAPCC